MDDIISEETSEEVTNVPAEITEPIVEAIEEARDEGKEHSEPDADDSLVVATVAAAEVAVALAEGQAALATQQAERSIADYEAELSHVKGELEWTKTQLTNLETKSTETLSSLESVRMELAELASRLLIQANSEPEPPTLVVEPEAMETPPSDEGESPAVRMEPERRPRVRRI